MLQIRISRQPIVTIGKLVAIPSVAIPGIGTASAYASGDAFGGKFAFHVPRKGIIYAATMLDLDNEGIETELWLFRKDFVATADNAAWAPSDTDLIYLQWVISITAFASANANKVGEKNGLGLPYFASEGKLYCQCVTRGAPNIAAAKIPVMTLWIFSHE